MKMSNTRRTRLQTSRVFLLSSLSWEDRRQYGKIIQQLGGIYFDCESFKASCTHLICGRLSRSEKFLGACATGKWILRPEYILASNENKEWLPEADFEWHPSSKKLDQQDLLLCAPMRCRLHFAISGEPAFKGWKVSVLVSDNKRAVVYKRLLTSGGALLYSLRMPVKDPAKVANTITFIFTDKKMAEPLLKQSLNEYGVLLLKPEFIGDYIIRHPHPDPMDYLVSDSSSPDLSGDRSLLHTSQENAQRSSAPASRQSLDFDDKMNSESAAGSSFLSLTSSLIRQNVPTVQELKRSTRSRSSQSTAAVQFSVKPLKAQSCESLPLIHKECDRSEKDSFSAGRCHVVRAMPADGSEIQPTSQVSLKSSRKFFKAKQRSLKATSDSSAGCSQEMKFLVSEVVNEKKDSGNFVSLETASVNSNDTKSSDGLMRRVSKRLAGVDPFIEYTSKYPGKADNTCNAKLLKIKKEDPDADFLSNETASVASTVNISSGGSQRMSMRLLKKEPVAGNENRRTVTTPDVTKPQASRASAVTALEGVSQLSKRTSRRCLRNKPVVWPANNLLSTTDRQRKEQGDADNSRCQQLEASVESTALGEGPDHSAEVTPVRIKSDGPKKVRQSVDTGADSQPLCQSSEGLFKDASLGSKSSDPDSQRRFLRSTKNAKIGDSDKLPFSAPDKCRLNLHLADAERDRLSLSESSSADTGVRSSSRETRSSKRLSGACAPGPSDSFKTVGSRGSGKRTQRKTSKTESADSQFIMFESDSELTTTPQFKRLSKNVSGASPDSEENTNCMDVMNFRSENSKELLNTNTTLAKEFEESRLKASPDKSISDSCEQEPAGSPVFSKGYKGINEVLKAGSSKADQELSKTAESMKDVIVVLSDCETSTLPQKQAEMEVKVKVEKKDSALESLSRPKSAQLKQIHSKTLRRRSSRNSSPLTVFFESLNKESQVFEDNRSQSIGTVIPKSSNRNTFAIEDDSSQMENTPRSLSQVSRVDSESPSQGSPKKFSQVSRVESVSSSEGSPKKLSQVSRVDSESPSQGSPKKFSQVSRVESVSSSEGSPKKLSQVSRVESVSPSQSSPKKLSQVSRVESVSSSEGSPKKLSQVSRQDSASSSHVSPRKLSQSSLQDFGFSSASKRHPPRTRMKFPQLPSRNSSCSSSPVSLSQGGGIQCSQPDGEPLTQSELSSLIPSRQETMEQDALSVTNSLKTFQIEKTVTEKRGKETKTETPINNSLSQTCGAKRKIFEDDLDMDDDTEPLVKRMKLSHPVQSWKPVPLGLKVDWPKDQRSVCTFPTQMPSSMCYLINSCVEEDFQQEALMFMQSSTQMYPTPQTLNTLMTQVLLKAKSLHIAQTAYRVLMSGLSMHPPTTRLVKDVYVSAFRQEEDSEGIWGFFISVISGALCVEMTSSQDRFTLLLQFIVAAFRHNFNSFMEEFKFCSQTKSRKSFRSCMLVQCLWYPSYMMFPNTRTQQLLAALEQCLLLPGNCRNKSAVLESILALVSMAAQCCQVADHNRVTTDHLECGERTSLFVGELARRITGACIEDESLLLTTLRNLQPSWVCLKVCQILLCNLDDYLLVIRPDDGLLTLSKIVSQYFFLLPRLSSSGPDNNKSDQMEPRRKHVCANKIRVPKNNSNEGGDVIPKASAARINKRNHLGETALHGACIKNDVPKLKQLLQVPDIDVNAKDNAGWTPLHEACNKGHIDCVEELLKYMPVRTVDSYFKKEETGRRVDLLSANSDGITPLHDAVTNNRLDVCRMLLKHGGQSLLKAQTKSGHFPKDLATTPSMYNMLTTPLTPGKQKEGDVSSSQDSVGSPGPHRKEFLPSAVLYEQVIGQRGCTMTASMADCRRYITLVTFLLQSYIRSTQLMIKQTYAHPRKAGSTTGPSNFPDKAAFSHVSKENQYPRRVARTRKPDKLSDFARGTEAVVMRTSDTNSDAENGRWISLNELVDAEQSPALRTEVLEEDLKIFRRLKHHLKNFSFHISKITSPEDFKSLEVRLSSMNVCTMAASKLN